MFQKVLFTIVFLFNILVAQEIGQIFNSNELEALFGKVLISKKIEVEEISKVIPLCNTHIMFQLIEGQIVILDQYRNQVYPVNKKINFDDETVFKLFNTSVLTRLLGYSNKNYLVVEKREKSLVVKFEKMAMERGVPCPPKCPINKYVLRSNQLYIDNNLVISSN